MAQSALTVRKSFLGLIYGSCAALNRADLKDSGFPGWHLSRAFLGPMKVNELPLKACFRANLSSTV